MTNKYGWNWRKTLCSMGIQWARNVSRGRTGTDNDDVIELSTRDEISCIHRNWVRKIVRCYFCVALICWVCVAKLWRRWERREGRGGREWKQSKKEKNAAKDSDKEMEEKEREKELLWHVCNEYDMVLAFWWWNAPPFLAVGNVLYEIAMVVLCVCVCVWKQLKLNYPNKEIVQHFYNRSNVNVHSQTLFLSISDERALSSSHVYHLKHTCCVHMTSLAISPRYSEFVFLSLAAYLCAYVYRRCVCIYFIVIIIVDPLIEQKQSE